MLSESIQSLTTTKKKAFRVGPATAAVHKLHTVIQAARIYWGEQRDTRTPAWPWSSPGLHCYGGLANTSCIHASTFPHVMNGG
jgi:hypothetical protein